jgi:hypothetical protein
LGEKEATKKEVSAAQAATMGMDCTGSAGDDTGGKHYWLSPSRSGLASRFRLLLLSDFIFGNCDSCHTILVYAQAPELFNAAVG